MVEKQMILAANEASLAHRRIHVLCVDDEIFNLEIMEKHLTKAGYAAICAPDAMKAYEILTQSRQPIDIVLLDRMMPAMDGIQLLRRMKSEPKLSHIPVILQTAKNTSEDASEGIQAGAYYYVTKPYTARMMLSVVAAAVREFKDQMLLQNQLLQHNAVLGFATQCEYEITNLLQARTLAGYFASYTPDPARYIMGITALMVNAIEHGMLEIGLEKKFELLLNGGWENEVALRQKLPENAQKSVHLTYLRKEDNMILQIKDPGKGFDWKQFMDFEPSRMTDPNGRGIAIANITNPEGLRYNAAGNVAEYVLPFKG